MIIEINYFTITITAARIRFISFRFLVLIPSAARIRFVLFPRCHTLGRTDPFRFGYYYYLFYKCTYRRRRVRSTVTI